jgi:DNA helicase-2/ATP-dependent DNA helicase PcrA
MNHWLLARSKAQEVRRQSEVKAGGELYGSALINAVAADFGQLDCVEVAGNSQLLGNDQAGYDLARYYADQGVIVVSRDLPDEETRSFYKAHEIGHRVLHTRSSGCRTDDANVSQLVLTLPYAEGRVATYSSRQLHENEATIFATELLVPSERLTARFDGGLSATDLAEEFQVPRHVIMAQMAASLLSPPADFEAALAASQEPQFSWRQLDDSQKRACCALPGPVLVQAGPGTGKTRTLTSRIEWLVSEKSVPPEHILALTFSNRAADELRSRLRYTLPSVAHLVTVSTFHSFGLELLRRYGQAAGYGSEIAVIDPVEAELLLEEHLSDLDLDYFADPARPNRYMVGLLRQISRAKEELRDHSAVLAEADRLMAEANDEGGRLLAGQIREIGRVYATYQALLHDECLVDYGDLVQVPVHLLRSQPEILAQLRGLYDHILVDEYQDINRANGELVQLLAGQDGQGLWAVGDLRQAIYRFRGATPEYLRQFDRHYPGATSFDLEVNYRAPKPLVDFLIEVGDRMSQRKPLGRPVWRSGVKGNDGRVIAAVADELEGEHQGITSTISSLLASGVQPRHIAVLCRTNSQATDLAKALSHVGLPVLHLGDFFLRKEVKDALAVLSMIVDGYTPAWPRIAALMPDPIDSDAAVVWWQGSRQESIRFPQALLTPPPSSQIQSPSQLAQLQRLGTMLITHARNPATKPWSVLSDFLFENGDYLRALRRQREPDRTQALLALGQLLSLARAFGQRALRGTAVAPVEAFIRHLRRLIERDDGDIDLPIDDVAIDAVHVLTIHKSKGLEFPIVFVPNLAEQRFPPRYVHEAVPDVVRPAEDGTTAETESEEESCLFVAISRCKQTLVLSRAASYHRRLGKPVSRKPSSLWQMLDPSLNALALNGRERWQEQLPGQAASRSWQEHLPEALTEAHGHVLLRDLRVYQRCPRQFYYRKVLKLAVPDDHDIYARFNEVILTLADWIHLQLAEGVQLNWEDVLVTLEQTNTKAIPADHVFAAWYRREARSRIEILWRRLDRLKAEQQIVRHHVPATVEVGGLFVDFHVDEVIELGERRIATQYRSGRVPKSLPDDPQLALYGIAIGREGPCEVQVFYLGADVTVSIPEKAQNKLLETLASDVASLRAGSFPPEPSYSRQSLTCATCRFLFLCPRGEELPVS